MTGLPPGSAGKLSILLGRVVAWPRSRWIRGSVGRSSSGGGGTASTRASVQAGQAWLIADRLEGIGRGRSHSRISCGLYAGVAAVPRVEPGVLRHRWRWPSRCTAGLAFLGRFNWAPGCSRWRRDDACLRDSRRTLSREQAGQLGDRGVLAQVNVDC